MKKLILILVVMLLISCNSTSQESIPKDNTNKGVWIDTRLEEYLIEYIAEAKIRGIDVLPQITTMYYIGFSNNIKYPVLGMASTDQKSVLIAEFCMLDKAVLKVVFFHEMTHSIFAVNHSNDSEFGIMRGISPKSFRIYEDEKFWKLRLDELFKDKIIVSK